MVQTDERTMHGRHKHVKWERSIRNKWIAAQMIAVTSEAAMREMTMEQINPIGITMESHILWKTEQVWNNGSLGCVVSWE